jgi:hypothetical protein
MIKNPGNFTLAWIFVETTAPVKALADCMFLDRLPDMRANSHRFSPSTRDLAPIPARWRDLPHPKIRPPADSKIQSLPFGELSWDNFQRLCLRLAMEQYPDLEWWIYGWQGHKQDGVDLIGIPHGKGRRVVVQCKRLAHFSPALLRGTIRLFLEGELSSHTKEMVLCVPLPLNQPSILRELARQRNIIKKKRAILLTLWDAEQTALLLKNRATVVEDFFGRPWVEVFCLGTVEPNRIAEAREQVLSIFRRRGKSVANKIHQSMQLLNTFKLSPEEIKDEISPLYLNHVLEMDYRSSESGRNLVSTGLVNLSSAPVHSDWEKAWGSVPTDNSQLKIRTYSPSGRSLFGAVSTEESTPTQKKFWFTFHPPLPSQEWIPIKYEFFWAGHRIVPGTRWHDFVIDAPISKLTLAIRSKRVSYGNVLEYTNIESRLLPSTEYHVRHRKDRHSLTLLAPAFGKTYSIQFTLGHP